tara:strand:+ start:154 stop:507 length:354 start_codon:yes stop_codon:yes gene_type:complete
MKITKNQLQKIIKEELSSFIIVESVKEVKDAFAKENKDLKPTTGDCVQSDWPGDHIGYKMSDGTYKKGKFLVVYLKSGAAASQVSTAGMNLKEIESGEVDFGRCKGLVKVVYKVGEQ